MDPADVKGSRLEPEAKCVISADSLKQIALWPPSYLCRDWKSIRGSTVDRICRLPDQCFSRMRRVSFHAPSIRSVHAASTTMCPTPPAGHTGAESASPRLRPISEAVFKVLLDLRVGSDMN
jgi:hypothetical protein